jgi:hypothetical protein
MNNEKKPQFMRMFDMSHVPSPDPENFWVLDLDEPRVIMCDDRSGDLQPLLTITVRKIHGNKVSLQITASPKMRRFYAQ